MLRKIFDVIQPDRGTSVASRLFDYFITTLILLSVACVYVITFDISPAIRDVLGRFEAFASIVFSVEYLLRIVTARFLFPNSGAVAARLRYIISPMAIIDLVAILPYWLPMFIPGSMLGIRAIRLVRILRLMKLSRYFAAISSISDVIRGKRRELFGSMFFVFLLMMVSSLVIYSVEHEAQPQVFRNAFSGLWWAVATLTTVGYGDIYPITTLGRLFGTLIALLGIGMVAIPTGIISSGLMERISDEEEKKEEPFKYCPHCGKRLKD